MLGSDELFRKSVQTAMAPSERGVSEICLACQFPEHTGMPFAFVVPTFIDPIESKYLRPMRSIRWQNMTVSLLVPSPEYRESRQTESTPLRRPASESS